MIYHHSPENYKNILPGVLLKTLTYGEKTLLSEFKLSKDSELPRHSHPQEQIGYLVSGHIRLTIGDDVYDVLPGDSWNVPGDIKHRAEIIEDSVAIEVFSPVREDYLPE
ncbi:MAG: cupin domain-containing protein [Anaerolineae bacterium]|nr:cupin domain-containing protein [Anaerolineae bacterium]